MKNITFLLLLFTIATFSTSCKDECKDVNCLNGGVCDEGICDCPVGFVGDKCEEKVNFNILNVKDTLVFVGDTTIVPISVVWLEGQTKETVTLEVTGLPANVTAQVQPNSGLPDFNANLLLIAAPTATTGTHTNLNVVGKIGSGLSVSKNFSIRVENNCRPDLVGFFDVVENCNSGGGPWNYTSQIVINPAVSNQITIMEFASTVGVNVNVIVDCDNRTLTIPTQQFPNQTVSGSGTFNPADFSISLNYTLVFPGNPVPTDCTMAFTKL